MVGPTGTPPPSHKFLLLTWQTSIQRKKTTTLHLTENESFLMLRNNQEEQQTAKKISINSRHQHVTELLYKLTLLEALQHSADITVKSGLTKEE